MTEASTLTKPAKLSIRNGHSKVDDLLDEKNYEEKENEEYTFEPKGFYIHGLFDGAVTSIGIHADRRQDPGG